MTEAIFGLVGVIIGGLLTAGTEHLARRATERRGQQLAARVLFDELANLAASARWSSKNANPDVSFAKKLELSAVWREHRRDLGTVPWHVWIAVDSAVASLETTTPGKDWDAGRREWLSTLAEDAQVALDALQPFVGGRPQRWALLRRGG